MKLAVPSSGSTIQVREPGSSPARRPPSSPRKLSDGNRERIDVTIRSSLSRSAIVTKSFFFFSSMEPAGRRRQ